jgi:hypothetical protein
MSNEYGNETSAPMPSIENRIMRRRKHEGSVENKIARRQRHEGRHEIARRQKYEDRKKQDGERDVR